MLDCIKANRATPYSVTDGGGDIVDGEYLHQSQHF
jgi:hypothetical protein